MKLLNAFSIELISLFVNICIKKTKVIIDFKFPSSNINRPKIVDMYKGFPFPQRAAYSLRTREKVEVKG